MRDRRHDRYRFSSPLSRDEVMFWALLAALIIAGAVGAWLRS